MDNKGGRGGRQTKGRRERRRLPVRGRRGGAGDRAWGREEGHKPKKLTYIGSPFVFGIAGKKPKLEASSSCERPSVTLKPTWAFQG